MSGYPRCGATGPDGAKCQIHADAPHDVHEWHGTLPVHHQWPVTLPAPSTEEETNHA